MVRKIWQGKAISGHAKMDNQRDFTMYLCSLEGKTIDVTVENHRTKRSTPQNSYLWGVVYEVIARHTGYSSDQVHDLMRYQFLRVEDGRTPGLYTITSTAKLSKDEFSTYIEEIKLWASEFLSVYIPSPDEVEV